MLYINSIILLNLFGWFFLSINKNAMFFEELFLALTFSLFFLGIIQAFNSFFLFYYVDRINSIKLNYKKIFLRRKESINSLIESYKIYRAYPDAFNIYASLLFLKYIERINIDALFEEKIIEEAYKKTLQELYKL